MKCTEIESRMDAYLEKKLDYKELDVFLEHIENCSECNEELEIKYIIRYGMSDEYDEQKGSYNFIKIIEDDLKTARQRVDNTIKRIRFRTYNWLLGNGIVLLSVLYFLHKMKWI